MTKREGIIKSREIKQTRGDRIRSMTDEELAEILADVLTGDKFCKDKPECREMLDKHIDIPDEMCQKCVVEWLREAQDE